jgi:hypothetical protein
MVRSYARNGNWPGAISNLQADYRQTKYILPESSSYLLILEREDAGNQSIFVDPFFKKGGCFLADNDAMIAGGY